MGIGCRVPGIARRHRGQAASVHRGSPRLFRPASSNVGIVNKRASWLSELANSARRVSARGTGPARGGIRALIHHGGEPPRVSYITRLRCPRCPACFSLRNPILHAPCRTSNSVSRSPRYLVVSLSSLHPYTTIATLSIPPIVPPSSQDPHPLTLYALLLTLNAESIRRLSARRMAGFGALARC